MVTELNVTPITRRRFVQQTVSATAALSGRPTFALAGARWILGEREQNASPLDAAAIRKLASEISGHVITTESPDYESARLVFNRAFDLRPALIVRCASSSDVARALDFAQSRKSPLAVRGGGHSRAGFGVCDSGVVIDLSGMKRVEVDQSKRVARAEAGALVRDLDEVTQRFGLATTSGGCPNVGLGGFTLGGGEGLLMSKYGAACDNVLSAYVVTVDGRQMEASQKSNADLFWAIRGGGGNFGVVTALEYRLHSVGEVLAGALIYPAAGRIPELLQVFAKFCGSAPDEMVPLGEFLPSNEGPQFINHVCYLGDPRTGNDLLARLRALKPQEEVRAMSYWEAQAAGFAPPAAPHFQTNLFLRELNEAALAAIATAINDAPPGYRVLIVPFFGAITRVAVGDMAFALRQTGYEVDVQCRWSAPAEKANAEQWVKALRDNLKPFAQGAYVNQLGETSEELVRMSYGPNYARLVEIKKKYDPKNLLRLNQNIRPA